MQLTDVIKCYLMTFGILLGITGIAVAQTQSNTRTCVVNEVTNAGGYTYIGCQEGSSQIWLALPQINVRNGEQISFTDTPPMVNFISKSMGRTFSKISFIPGITRSGYSALDSNSGSPSKYNMATPYDDTYSGIDDNGTVVFTDDPSKAPKNRLKVKKTKQIKFKNQDGVALPNNSRTIEQSPSRPSRVTLPKKIQSLEQDENNLKSPNSSSRKFYSESNTSPKDSCQKPVMDSNCTTKVLRKYVPPDCLNRTVSDGPPKYDAICDEAINSSQARVELDQCITGWKIDAECKRLMEINGLYGR